MKQIAIKLNKERFDPIVKDMLDLGVCDSPSELAGGCIWFCHEMFYNDSFGIKEELFRMMRFTSREEAMRKLCIQFKKFNKPKK